MYILVDFVHRTGMSVKLTGMFYIQFHKFIPKYQCKLFVSVQAHGYASQFDGVQHAGLFGVFLYPSEVVALVSEVYEYTCILQM